MTLFQQQDILELTQGNALLRIAPQAGGRLLSWHIDGAPVIHWPDHPDWSAPPKIRGGNPLLFPFLGRHRVDGEIGFWKDAQGVVRELPMHGFARDLPFEASVDADNAGVRMTLTDNAATRDGYPFGFRFEAAYRLVDANTLDVELTTFNTGATGTPALPYYAGHHFYFSLPHTQRGETVLTLPPTQRRHQQADGTISAPETGDPRYTLDDPRIYDRFHCLDTSAARATQPVRVEMPGLNRSVTIDLNRPGSLPWYAVTTWTEAPDSDFYCVEPWLGLPDAIHNGLGLRWIEPGSHETATLRITVGALR
ncbi:aldose epimerase [Paraburkholderia sp.]|uniref:aldose epimerase family protein n=1 Tax=Paraburkholderia sp. TaxID=1926495 RepID=UPI00239C3CD5|nr:aldose epimerase [Paraburkholderia sp.]MDE1183747.1 aldose epimerase [Paraburkholderia sp.]